MNEHLTIELLQSYERRKVSRAELDIVNEHLYSCETCYQTFLTIFQKRFPIEIDLDELSGLKGWHLAGDELRAYLNGRMNKLDFNHASRHLNKCYACRQEFYDACERQLQRTPPGRIVGEIIGYIFSRLLPPIDSIAPNRLRVAGFAVAVLSLAAVLWFLARPHVHATNGLAEVLVTRTPHPEPPRILSKTQSVQPPEPTAPTHVDGVESPVQRKGTDNRESATDSALLARNLVMPPVIAAFDRSQAVVVRGNSALSETLSVLRPYSTVTMEDRPTFSWTSLQGAQSYAVSVYDENLNLIARSAPLAETRWAIPDSLHRGSQYTWLVTALKDGKQIVAPALPARAEFQVMNHSELVNLKLRLKGTGSHAARGILYAEAGLLDQAEQELQVEASLLPRDKRAERLVRTIRSWRDGQSYIPPSPVTTNPAQ